MIAMLAEREHGNSVIWKTTNAQHALEHCLFDREQPDIIVLDISLNGISGIEVCRRIRARSATISILCVTAYPLTHYQTQAIESGAQALLSKDRLLSPIFQETLHALSDGQPYPPGQGFLPVDQAYERLLNIQSSVRQSLTAREREILECYAEDLTTREIAQQLRVSENTVFSHLNHAMKKMRLHGKAETIRMFKRIREQ
ncbi:DNA-binding response regulator [Bifidobacterium eulemuris]|nr:DNA-binding response regulator [Bifidobacterium eulemuris]